MRLKSCCSVPQVSAASEAESKSTRLLRVARPPLRLVQSAVNSIQAQCLDALTADMSPIDQKLR